MPDFRDHDERWDVRHGALFIVLVVVVTVTIVFAMATATRIWW